MGQKNGVRSAPERQGGAGGRRESVFDAVPPLRALRALSPQTAVGKLVSRMWSTTRALVVCCEVADVPSCPPGAPRLEMSFVEPEQILDILALLPGARDDDALILSAMERTRAASAGELVLAHESGHLVGMHFIHTAVHGERLARVSPLLYAPLAADEVLTEAVFVLPSFRGRGVGSAMLRASLRHLAERSFRRALAVIDVENRRSLRAFHAAGFRPLTTMRLDTYVLGRRTSELIERDAETHRRYLDATDAARRPAHTSRGAHTRR
jgi:GNAT superfamily N-acetyltransferase